MLSVGAMRNFFNRFGNGCALLILGVFAVSLVAGYNFGGGGGGRAGRGEQTGTVIATVNGQQLTESDYQEAYEHVVGRNSPEPGPAYAAAHGDAMDYLIKQTVIFQEAERRHARPLDADIDKAVDEARASVAQNLGKQKLTDQEWDTFLMNSRHWTNSELRADLARNLIPRALRNQLKADEHVTEAEARNQTALVHLVMVTVPYQAPNSPPPSGPKAKPLPTEAEAKQRIDALYAKIKAGADIKDVAKSNPDDPNAKRSGDTGSIQEYPNPGQGGFSADLSLFYGPALADAVHKLTDGQITDVVQLSGLEKGFAVAKLIARTANTPKDFDPKKAIAALAEQRAGKKLNALIIKLSKAAKVEIKDPDKRAYYDYAKMEMAQSEALQDMQNGIVTAPPTQAEQEAQKAIVIKDFEELLKRHPDDTTAAIIVADDLKAKNKLMDQATQDRLLKLNELIVKNNDDFTRHFDLADTYREKKLYDKAKEHLNRIAKLLSYNTPTDLDGLKQTDTTHTKLETAYRSINATVEADKEKQILADLQTKITQAALKQEMEQRAAAAKKAAEKAAQKAADNSLEKSNGKSNGKSNQKSGTPTGATPAPDAANTITLQPGATSSNSLPIQITPAPSSGSGVPGLGSPNGATTPLTSPPSTKKP